MAITVAQARTEFEQRKKDISDIDQVAGTFLKWCNYINRFAYRQFTNIFPESWIATQVYNVQPTISSYDLPDDFQDIIPAGTGLFKIDANGNATPYRLATTSFASTTTGFYLTATSIVFTPIPVSTIQYNFRYIPLLTDLSGESSELIIPQRFSQYMMDVLDACYNVWDEDPSAEVFNDARVIRSMNELVSLIKPDSQTYGLPDFLGC